MIEEIIISFILRCRQKEGYIWMAEDAQPVLLAYVLSRFGRLNLIWLSFVLAEGIVVPIALTLWKKESRRTLVD